MPVFRQAFREIERVERQQGGRIRFAFRHFPLVEIHPHAFAAAAAAEAAALQDRFWDIPAPRRLRRTDIDGGIGRMTAICSHTDSITITELPDEIAGCEDCLAIGGRWVHLRMCQSCGHIACCDSSPNRHASAHARDAGHPIARSAEPGEDWSWCYVDNTAFTVTGP